MHETITTYDETGSAPILSIVVPLYNEEGNVRPLVEALADALAPMATTYEIILVDDGSRDRTWQHINEIALQHQCVKGIKLARNFGHQHALNAGFQLATGQAILSMDGDLQHPPTLVPQLFQAWQKGYKVVTTYRVDTETTSFFKRTTSLAFYRVFSSLSEVNLSPGHSDFRLLDRQVLEALLALKGANAFLRGAIEWLGFPAKTIPFQVNERYSGKSKYSLRKMLGFAGTALVSFSTKPLKLGIWLGIITSTLAFMELIYILIQFVRGVTLPGWASTVGILSFLFGILFIILGIIGIYIANIHEALQNRPPFVVDELVNFK